jgi:hypothetical protein
MVGKCSGVMRCLTTCPALAEDERELGEFTPSFLWLLRDFYFDLEEDGRKVRKLSRTQLPHLSRVKLDLAASNY